MIVTGYDVWYHSWYLHCRFRYTFSRDFGSEKGLLLRSPLRAAHTSPSLHGSSYVSLCDTFLL